MKRATSRSVSQRYGSEDPDLFQNVTDPDHCYLAKRKVAYLSDTLAGKFQYRSYLTKKSKPTVAYLYQQAK
jgi:hypothetical protein